MTSQMNTGSRDASDGRALDRLYETILLRKGTDPTSSYTAKLLDKGLSQCAKKLGEEGVEAALAGALGDHQGLVSESADLLYHLLVMWAAVGVAPEEVYGRLGEREGKSGLKEKASRVDPD